MQVHADMQYQHAVSKGQSLKIILRLALSRRSSKDTRPNPLITRVLFIINFKENVTFLFR